MARHYRTCDLCEAMCGLAIDVEGGRITSIRGDEHDVLSRGYICPKALALGDHHQDPDRLRQPMRRTAAGWQAVGWDEALEEAAQRLHAVEAAEGRHAIAVYQGNPVVHDHGAVLGGQVLLKTLRTRSVFSATSVDQLPHMLASLLMFGHQLLLPVPDVDRTDYFLVLGANPLASNGSLMTAPGMPRRLKALRARGGRLVVVDPRRTETAALADRHLAIRPGTDAALLLALVNVLFAEKRVKPGRLAAFTDGLETVEALARTCPPEAAAAFTGLPAEAIATLARELSDAPAAAVYGRVGVSVQEFGGLACWLVNVLNVLTGNLDRAGGALLPQPAADLAALATRIGQRGSYGRRHTRVRGLPEFGGEWPVATLAEEIETEGPGRIRALVTVAGNPVLSTPNGRRLDAALDKLDFMVSIDGYLNETTRHAHLVLPPVSHLERDHYDLIFHTLAVRNTAKYSAPLFTPPPGGRTDWSILLGLAERVAAKRGASWRDRLGFGALRRLGATGLLGLLLRLGPHGSLWPGRGLSLARLAAEPHGVDLGPLQPSLPDRLAGRRIDLAPAVLVADVERLRRRLAESPAAGLQLIGRRELRSNNSWLHNSERLVKGRERCTLLMHPDDAAARGLKDGARVRVASRAGAVEVPLTVTADMRPGVVSLPHGWGHGREGVRLGVAGRRPGASLNDVTDEQAVDLLAGTAVLNGTVVTVEMSR